MRKTFQFCFLTFCLFVQRVLLITCVKIIISIFFLSLSRLLYELWQDESFGYNRWIEVSKSTAIRETCTGSENPLHSFHELIWNHKGRLNFVCSCISSWPRSKGNSGMAAPLNDASVYLPGLSQNVKN